MARSTRSTRILSLVLATGTVLVLACWAVVMLQGEGPGAPLGGPVRIPPAADPAEEPALPQAPQRERPRRPAPEVIRTEQLRLGPKAILGRVLDAQTEAPLPAFQVYVLEHGPEDPLLRLEQAVPQPFHRPQGIFRIDKAPGHYDVVVRAPGYLPVSLADVEVPALDSRPLDFAAHTGPGLAGRVLDQSGTGVAGVKLFLHVTALRNPGDQQPRSSIAHSGLDGSFSFSPLSPGEYVISAHEPTNTVDRLAGLRVHDDTTRCELWLTPRHQVTVRLRDNRGRPVDGAQISLQAPGHLVSGRSNEYGLALLQYAPDGDYTLEVQHRDYEPEQDALLLSGGSSDQLRFYTLRDRTDD